MKRAQIEEGKWIGDLAGAICDPVIVFPDTGWEKSIPEWVFPDIKLQRLIDLALQHKRDNGEEPLASDLEAMVYIYPASLAFPLSHDWAEIYLYVATQAMKLRHPPVEMPGDIKRDDLTPDQKRQLNNLKRWLYRKRIEARKEKERGVRREARKQEQATRFSPAQAPKQIQMF